MKKLILLSLLTTACNIPTKEDVVEACGDLISQAKVEIWEECTLYYEETVVPSILEQVNTLLAALPEILKATAKQLIDEYMEKMGCYPTDNVFGWDCTGTPLCRIKVEP